MHRSELLLYVSCFFLFLALSFAGGLSFASTVRIAVVDTGYNKTPENFYLCAEGHADFTNAGMRDRLKHGTNILSLIARHLPSKGACIIMIKVFDSTTVGHMKSYLKGLEYAAKLNTEIVNISISGRNENKTEKLLIQRMLNQGQKLVIAAGNSGLNFDKDGCIIYPACYDKRIIIAGDYKRYNKGSHIDAYAPGYRQVGGGLIKSGTSMSAAHVSGYIGALMVNFRLGGPRMGRCLEE